ncbi:peptide MFS transporter [Qipengyuania sp. DY56-A-20]|jgi:proton-dependent oligopeptide transporter, POT family|uniref:Peptide MFS transporter n=1 Tax=Qipengyuania benthica TaxID=3067651 RepID=A0ABT9H4K6_9SPHN|nr:peptide MFS transporter [Qipengyuania sp. DY56-A-20]MBU1253875.1 peptide MFS transporter [Alphaproteobacteria bacterium]MBU1605322.1 peptide MFS transporter [Alphaproteobacteria bacterium]MDP4538249.1 peptide MFS transporter [Qipengyuania sp. DY56-A-20]
MVEGLFFTYGSAFEMWAFRVAVIALVSFLIGGMVLVTRPQAEVIGHPKGLFLLFMAEMWERFSYYGMRALLIFYLVQHWLFSDSEASIIYGAYTALVYITPVVGGYLADQYIGQRKAVLFGAVLLTFGHFFMAFEGGGGQGDPMINVFWLALALIIVGSGFLKANISVIVGQLYSRTDVRRDPAYTIFYMGINVGAATASIICGYLGQTYGWQYGFGLAGFGMLIGLVFFVIGKPLLLGKGEPKDPEKIKGLKEWGIYGAGLAMVLLCWAAIQYQALVGYVVGGFGGGLVLYVLFTAVTKLSPEERDRIFAAMFLILTSIVFWALFEQAGSSLNLFTDRHVDTQGVNASMFQSINAIYIVLLAPVFAFAWQKLAQKGAEPSTPLKFGLAVIQVGLGFLVLVWGAESAGVNVPTPVLFIFLVYLLHTTGELCLSPVGLSAMNRLSPAHMASLIMGTWFFASATGNFAAGLIASATGGEGVGEEAGKQVVLDVYSTVGWYAVGIGVAVMVVSPLIKKLMHLDTLADDDVGDDLEGQSQAGIEAQEAGVHPATSPQAPGKHEQNR